jgi:hypothetical protein
MASRTKSQSAWTDVKAKLASLDRKGLLGLIWDLYAAHKDNQMFLHARFALGALSPYKETIARWLWPDSFRNQDTSVLKVKKPICPIQEGDCGCRRTGRVDGFLLRTAAGFSSDLGYHESYFDALVRVFNQAIVTANRLPGGSRNALIVRLDRVRSISHELGYGVGDAMDFILAKYTKRKARPVPIQLSPGSTWAIQIPSALPKGHLQWTAFLKRLRLDSATRPNQIDEAVKRSIEEPHPGSREERHRKGLLGFRRLDHSSLDLLRLPNSRTIGASFIFCRGCRLNRAVVCDIIERQRSIHSNSHEPKRSPRQARRLSEDLGDHVPGYRGSSPLGGKISNQEQCANAYE